jgi:hypothetical protein
LVITSANATAPHDEIVTFLANDQTLPASLRLAVARKWHADTPLRSAKHRSKNHAARAFKAIEPTTSIKADHGAPDAVSQQKTSAANANATTDRAVLPILFGIVQDLAAKPAERRQAALQLAQYFLPKKPTIKKSRHGNFLPDECGFVVDPDLARELRDLKLELACLPFSSKKRSPHIVARKASELQKRIEEIRQSLECPCPSRYQLKRHVSAGPDGEIVQDGEIAWDKARIESLRRGRVEKKIFTPEEDLEEAVRTARYESFLLGQEMTGRHRLAELREKQRAARIGYGPLLTAGQAAVLRVLTLLYPPPPKPPPSEIMLADHPFLDLQARAPRR